MLALELACMAPLGLNQGLEDRDLSCSSALGIPFALGHLEPRLEGSDLRLGSTGLACHLDHLGLQSREPGEPFSLT